MNLEEFRSSGHEVIEWIVSYYQHIDRLPVRSPVNPGEIRDQLPRTISDGGEPFSALLEEFNSVLLPGITHWQHPRFFAYFPASTSPPSILAELLSAALGAQCMSWETSPAATELEEHCLSLLRDLLGLEKSFYGVIQDGASAATLSAVLMARERAFGLAATGAGLSGLPPLAVYCSEEAHSSVDKAVRIAGIGERMLRKIPTDEKLSLCSKVLKERIAQDRQQGIVPLCVVATFGTTGTAAIDPLAEIADICKQAEIFLHVDGAYAGSALLLPEYHSYSREISKADSFVFNPHKWLLTNFDCSAFYVRDRDLLRQTFEIAPPYLVTNNDNKVTNLKDYGISLGRRFRALKLWFVLRCYGIEALQAMLRKHITFAKLFAELVTSDPRFELIGAPAFGLVVFRIQDEQMDHNSSDSLNMCLKERLNSSGEIYLTHTKVKGRSALRLAIGQRLTAESDIHAAWRIISDMATEVLKQKDSAQMEIA